MRAKARNAIYAGRLLQLGNMENRILGIFILIFFFSCSEEKELILSKHDNGQIHELLILKKPITEDGVGFKRIFFPNGDLQCEGGYKYGKRHGEWICYYRNGKIEWKSTYDEGVENGETYCQYENGTWKKVNMTNGIKSGKTVEFNFDNTENKYYFIYGQYKDDLETGIWIWKDTLQKKIEERNYEKGINTGYFAHYYPNGNIKIKGEGYIEGNNQFNLINDSLFFFNEFEEGKIDSLEIYENGRLKRKIKLQKE